MTFTVNLYPGNWDFRLIRMRCWETSTKNWATFPKSQKLWSQFQLVWSGFFNGTYAF